MKHLLIILMGITALFFSGCEDDAGILSIERELIEGDWQLTKMVLKTNTGDYTYPEYKDENLLLNFRQNGSYSDVFISPQNNRNNDGSWCMEDDLLIINSPQWKGKYKIILSAGELTVKINRSFRCTFIRI